jgi:hypothetical protein
MLTKSIYASDGQLTMQNVMQFLHGRFDVKSKARKKILHLIFGCWHKYQIIFPADVRFLNAVAGVFPATQLSRIICVEVTGYKNLF